MNRRNFSPRATFRRAFATILALAGLISQGWPAPSGFVLVQAGRPAATIVTAAQPSENARAAADELQRYVRKMSGADLPVVRDNQSPTGPLILVGSNRFTESVPGLAIPAGLTRELREEGFVIHCQGDRLVLAGNDAGPYYGTRYAVVELLHRLGVRWFMPGEFGEVVPQVKTLAVPEMDVRQRPAFRMRNYWQHHRGNMEAEDTEWKLHHKLNPRMQDWFGVPGDSSIRNHLPDKDQFKAHPEWFALRRDGTRDEHMACMTSTGMVAHFVQRVKADARAGKRHSAFAPDDGMPRCYCDHCQKLANGFDGYGSNDRDPLVEASISNEWFHFINAILDEVNREFPDHKIVTNGYANRDIPPELPRFNPRQNLVVMFANICACTLHAYDDPHCWQMQRQGQMIRQWGRLCDKVWLYNYNYTMLVSKFTITPMVSRVRRNIPLLKEWGVLGFHDQDEADWALTGIPTRLVRAALEWDTATDVDALLDDFYTRWFGRAADPMKAYYTALESAFAKSTAHGHEDVVLNSIYTPDLVKKLAEAIQQAEQRAESEPEKSHVSLERKMFDYLGDYVSMEAAKRECRFTEAARLADGLMQRQKELNRISPFLGYEPYAVYGPDWEAKRMRKLATNTDGAGGKLVTVLPETARVRPDPFDDGRYERWQEANFDDSGWKELRTTAGWENQGFSDAQGRAYRGVMWYRLKVDIPADASGKAAWLCAPAVVNEAWVWVNGQYAGHRAYQLPWFRPQSLELDITALIRPGERNQITFRVLNNVDVFGASGIYERMFIYARNAKQIGAQSLNPIGSMKPAPKKSSIAAPRQRLRAIAATVLLALGLGAPWTFAADLPVSPLILDSRHQLFLDDHLVASLTRVKRTVEQAQKFAGNPVLWPTASWEPPMATAYGTTLRDGDTFRMWYKSGMGVAYAESTDGIMWRKPRLEFVRVNGEPSNILFTKKSKTEGPAEFPYFYELFGVHRDERDPDPARRYKMGFLCIDWKYRGTDGDPWHKGQRRGLGVAASPDGLRWKLLNSWATEAIVDGATHWMWDTTRDRYLLYGRTRKSLPEVVAAWQTNDWFKNWFSGRAVARVESPDFLTWNFTKPDTAPVVLTADLQDPPGTEVYSMKVFPYEGLYICLVQVFHATPDDSTLDVQLAVSRDGVHFTRVGDRRVFIPLGAVGSWDRFNLSLANNDPIAVSDELRFYYGGRMYRHGPYSGPDKGPEKSGIGFAAIQRDRFVALEASFDGGEIVTRPVRLKSTALRLNAKSDFGEIVVEVLAANGQVLAKSAPIQRDGLNLAVEWREGFQLPEAPVALRIKLTNARLFALWCE